MLRLTKLSSWFFLLLAVPASLLLGGPGEGYSRSFSLLVGKGDYGKTSQRFWVVVASQDDGVSCHWSKQVSKHWPSPGAVWPRMNIWDWPVVRNFTYGTVLVANQIPAGFVMIADERGKPWLKVRMGEKDEICLVRANTHYIVPLELP